ncbi:patatin-like phospholipase [Aspergillus similis]
MYQKLDSSWLEVNSGQNGPLVRDRGRLKRVISELAQPDQQYPNLSVFLGSKQKDTVLQVLFPHNNIRRTGSGAGINLRYDMVSTENKEPLLFADGDFNESPVSQPQRVLPGDKVFSCRPTSPRCALQEVYSRLIFPFANLICIFAPDFENLASVAQYLVGFAGAGLSSNLPLAVRPKVIVVLEDDHSIEPKPPSHDIAHFYQLVRAVDQSQLRESFSSVNLISLDRKLPGTIRYEKLRLSIREQQIAMQAVRRENWCHFNARQLDALFQSALRSFSVESPFDLIRATRTDFPVPVGLHHNLAHFIDLGLREGCPLGALTRAIASALLMDHYVPGMMMAEPRTVFRTLYLSSVMKGWRGAGHSLGRQQYELADLVEQDFVEGFRTISTSAKTSVELRRETLLALCHELGKIQSHTVCLYCLLFGTPASNAEYQFTLSMCLLCLSRDDLVVEVLPPTMTPTILAIDGGGVRGVIPLEYLTLIQESLGRDLKLCDLVDLSIGPSSGGLIALAVSGMEWDIPTCSDMFDRLARRIFQERTQPTLAGLLQRFFGQGSFMGKFVQLLWWVYHDGCYDTRIFDASLREAFREDRRIFGAVGSNTHSNSKSKFAVIATNIAKETTSFVFGNFNAVDWFARDKHEYQLFRAAEADGEPLVWEVSYFSTANLGPKGSFQDGGLKDNFAADIARRICRRIWPSKPGITRLLSLGTGQTNSPQHCAPLFRNVLRDGFLQRSYQAFMSQMDTMPKWLKMKNELDEATKQDYLRFDVQLENVPCTIDNTNLMDDYRNLVIGQPGSNRMARDAATALLVGRFYFTLQCPLEESTGAGYAWCHGTIRCKGPVRHIVEALQAQHHQQMDFVTDAQHLAAFGGLDDICSACGRYSNKVSILLGHYNESVSIYLRVNRRIKWRISGFPIDISSHAQQLESPFGRSDHGRPAAAPCVLCDEAKTSLTERRRKRKSASPHKQPCKRVCVEVRA